jgi:hypothetical protein
LREEPTDPRFPFRSGSISQPARQEKMARTTQTHYIALRYRNEEHALHLYEKARASGEKIFAVAPMIDWTDRA